MRFSGRNLYQFRHIGVAVVNMARQKKGSKGPQDRNSNIQLKNGNSVSKTKGKMPATEKHAETKSAAKNGFVSGITSSITKMLKH